MTLNQYPSAIALVAVTSLMRSSEVSPLVVMPSRMIARLFAARAWITAALANAM
jgi:hypothetical protein